MNLTTNAYHAMETTGGELNVSFKEKNITQVNKISSDMKPGAYACLSVKDTGVGMDDATMDKIFDPFYTTKGEGKGTGMGLSVVHGIIKNMKGEIQVSSEPGQGTEFKIYFPVEAEANPTLPDRNELNLEDGGTERILLVDDEISITEMGQTMLETLGYKVDTCSSGVKALELFRPDPMQFDLVITDMAMPEMTGEKLTAKLRGLRPDIPVLICTGFSETMSEKKASELGINGFLLKPILIGELAQKIRQILDHPAEDQS